MPGLFGRFSLWDVLVYIGVILVAIVLVRLFAPRYFDRVVAVASLGALATFIAIVGIQVESWSLRIVLIVTALMAAYDFWLDAFSSKAHSTSETVPAERDKPHDSI